MKYANLHLHTNYSDGVLTPLELCRKAKAMGYGALAITDHNTVSGWKAFRTAAEAESMGYLLGMECNVMDAGRNFHIVAYDFDPAAPGIAAYIRTNEETMYRITRAKFDACLQRGHIAGITWQEVLEDAPEGCWICNEQVFASLVKRTDVTQKDYWPFVKGFNGTAVEVENTIRPYTARELIGMIRDAGGVASLAHPQKQTQYLPELHNAGLNCVEYDHPDIDNFDAAEARAFALSHGMYLAGGTDHTGQLSNYPEQRGDPPHMKESAFLQSLANDVRCGATEEEFLALCQRVYG